MLVERRHIGLIAADPAQCLGQEDVELVMLRIVHQPLDAESQDRASPGDGRIPVRTDDLSSLPLRVFAAKLDLPRFRSGLLRAML